ncbi:MAG: GMC family oxidoreductase [Saprospiraceae bacterium]|jgi:choline dehydrogenase-like flavoprotein|nr:GMC family oxidoreductase [Saprospiraceae bacterium]MBK6480797.1 GMC family oxidoreductase [Saprospiraceae bacterium]MBK7436132.1 GMC family oxidoreductase [Saprospiraceae bacterium]MBK8776850.1 GMC family oxidoreductase [Saprospiraceae bacterium]MBK9680199.1 GMC family oxidoreductase [Saprospiraceae bacterium]
MPNFNIDSQKKRKYDAIVIGSGISGGWSAKELTDRGMKTLMLERGRDVKHIVDYPTATLQPWEFEHRRQLPLEVRKANPVISKCYAFYEGTTQFFVKDEEHPYVQEKPFDWIRGYQVGGKSLMWARMTQRWSDYDYDGPSRDGYAVDWPIRYADIAPWYSHVEKFAGITGNKDGLPTLPDGEFLPAYELSCVEQYFKDQMATHYKDRYVISGRTAHLSQPQDIHYKQGRAKCVHRTICERGCPYGGYFSSNASTIPWALKSGKLTLRPHSVVHSIIYDEEKGTATGVRVIDANTMEMMEFYAKVIFVNAAALNSNLILLNSTSNRFPNGFGNDSGVLGKYVAFHNYRARISAEYEGHLDSTTDGRKPSSGYIPRFRNVYKQETDFLRGYASGFSASRGDYRSNDGIGTELKENLSKSTPDNRWRVGSGIMGETIPKESNYVALDETKKDQWGIPQLKISVGYDDNDEKMIKDFFEQFTEMYTKAGFKNIRTSDSKQAAGLDIHEMGGVRMGKDPKTSMLNKWHQIHACKNVFVTDGSCMTSTSTQNPSLTYMAYSARAADFAVQELKKRNL